MGQSTFNAMTISFSVCSNYDFGNNVCFCFNIPQDPSRQRRRKRGGGLGGAAPPNMKSGGGGRKYVFAPPIIVHIYNTSILNGWLYLK